VLTLRDRATAFLRLAKIAQKSKPPAAARVLETGFASWPRQAAAADQSWTRPSFLLSTFSSGLAGVVIGGGTSLATTWLTMISQTRAARVAAERYARQDLSER